MDIFLHRTEPKNLPNKALTKPNYICFKTDCLKHVNLYDAFLLLASMLSCFYLRIIKSSGISLPLYKIVSPF